jgi:hypothetical protein
MNMSTSAICRRTSSNASLLNGSVSASRNRSSPCNVITTGRLNSRRNGFARQISKV